ncbi:hypothetical protein EJ110_NYTH39771 [Nymphaea thermarum]|nr:hypothetical protein EJ110_NYTH39771 [Nymphaea thermarum]
MGQGEEINKLVARLHGEEKKCCVISVVGQAGLGKTVLAKEVYNRAKGSFSIMPQPSENEMKETNEGEMRRNIASKLKGERYFIVLDDAIKAAFANRPQNGAAMYAPTVLLLGLGRISCDYRRKPCQPCQGNNPAWHIHYMFSCLAYSLHVCKDRPPPSSRLGTGIGESDDSANGGVT